MHLLLHCYKGYNYCTATKDINNKVVISPMLLRTTSPCRSHRLTCPVIHPFLVLLQLLQDLPLLTQLLLAFEVLFFDLRALPLLKPEDRALLVIDTMQFFIFLFEVEDLIDNTADIAILLALLRSRLHSYRLSNNRVLQAA